MRSLLKMPEKPHLGLRKTQNYSRQKIFVSFVNRYVAVNSCKKSDTFYALTFDNT